MEGKSQAKLIKDYEPDQIFNSDETRLLYRALPEHSLMFKNKPSAGIKNVKQR